MLNIRCAKSMRIRRMRMATRAWLGSMALLWIVLSSHCVLEFMPGMDFLTCSADKEEAASDSHGCDKTCCAVEFGDYQAKRDTELMTPICFIGIVTIHDACSLEQAILPVLGWGSATAAPPEIPKTWQFASRAALPIRAPSIAS